VRALLVNVPSYGSHLRGVPLGLLYIIAACRRAGRDVALFDGNLCPDKDRFTRTLLGSDFDVLGLSAITQNIAEAYMVATIVKDARPNVKIVIGGVHASTVPDEVAAECPDCFVIQGEGEEAFPAFLDALEGTRGFDAVPGLLWREGGLLRKNPPRAVVDLDALPLPAYDLVDFADYKLGVHGLFFRRTPLTSMITSRGCPFKCTFCAKTALTGFTWRARSAVSVLNEIEVLVTRYGIREIHFEDDNIALRPERLVEICSGIIDRKLDIAWKCPHGIYAGGLDGETMRLMKRSGCYSLSFGVESGDDDILARAGKTGTTATIRKSIEAARAAGIQCIGFFIFGLEGETPRTIRRTIEFAKSLPLDAAQFNLCIPFKGTPIRETYLHLGFVADDNPSMYDVDHAVVSLPGLSPRDLRRWRLQAFLEFYARPSIIIRNLKNLSSGDVMKALFYRLRNIWRA
jgi:radical SAM superfamily enzyme YgiQ (UPF0313 family)